MNLDRNDPHGFLAKITKAKELIDYKKPIQGMECDFRVTAKSAIIPISKWRFVDERQRRAINIDYDRDLSR